MINLIPLQEKKRVTHEYWLRVATVWILLLSFSGLLIIFVMVPAYVLISIQISNGAETSRLALEKVAEYEAATKELEQSNRQAKAVVDNLRPAPFSRYVGMVRNHEHTGIVISSISIGSEGDEFAPIVVIGEAATRQALASFRERLLAEPGVANVELPISNLAKDREIQFDLTIVLEKPS